MNLSSIVANADRQLKRLQDMADYCQYPVDRDEIYRKICKYITDLDFGESPTMIDIEKLLQKIVYRIYLWNKWERS